ncbi:MAG: hypothetical protein EOP49_32930, partial [Sphingobacteriales bacterium]
MAFMKYQVLFCLLTVTLSIKSQPRIYLADLASMKTAVEKTASFKAQIKGEKRAAFNVLYKQLTADSTLTPGDYLYFHNLSRLIFPLRDNHLGFYQAPNEVPFMTSKSIDSFVDTKEFRDYPRTTLNIDSLKNVLSKKPVDSIEG